MRYVEVTDITPQNWNHANNGGDYWFGRVLAIDSENRVLGVKFLTSATDWYYCPVCGIFVLNDSDVESHGWNHRTQIKTNQNNDIISGKDSGNDVTSKYDDDSYLDGTFAIVVDE